MVRGSGLAIGLVLGWLGLAEAARAAETVSAEEWAFRYQRIAGGIDATRSLIELFEPEKQYCRFPLRPAKVDDLALLDRWQENLRRYDLDAANLARGIAEGLRNTPEFERLTGVKAEPATWLRLRNKARDAMRLVPPKRDAVIAAPEVDCEKRPPPPPPPPPPPDPTAGLVPPAYEPVATPALPERLCSEEEKAALLRAIGRERQSAIDNSLKAAHFRHDLSTALNEGRGDPATLRAMHQQATADMTSWDARWEELGRLYQQALAMPVVDCRTRTGAEAPPATAPQFGFAGGEGGAIWKGLPDANAGLGVIDVGGEEKRFLELDSSLHGGSFSAWAYLPNVAPETLGSGTALYLNGSYGEAEASGSRSVAPEPGVVNGITWWKEEAGSSGISSADSGLRGWYDFEWRGAELRVGLKGELPCGDDEDEPPFGADILGRAVTLYDLGLGFGYDTQRSTSQVQLENMNPGFSLFDVSSRAQVDLRDLRTFLRGGLVHVQPLGEGFNVTLGGHAELGYFDASAHGTERNRCNVQFAAMPGVNQCNPAQVDFTLKTHPQDDGLHTALGLTARLDWQVPALEGLGLGAQYDLDWTGVPRFEAPTNLAEDGQPDLGRSHELSHRLQLGIVYRF